ncbi:cytochrome P450 [Actinacidiphila glaucinigra]|uniref:cytochrome P450 n=1 Tax=Actinacidiphila glaucinigra TaxID=235986 RepID=UPI0037C4F188
MAPADIQRLYGPAVDDDPSGMYERLRERHGDVAPVLLHGEIPAWLVLGHRTTLEVLRSPKRFTRDSREWTAVKSGQLGMDSPILPMVAWQPLCIFVDGDEHKRLRGAVTRALGAFKSNGIRSIVTRFVHQLVDEFVREGKADLVSQFAEKLPMLVMTRLLGMPEEYGPQLVDAARDLMKGTETALASNAYITEVLQQLVERKGDNPAHDLASWLINDESKLTTDEVVEHLRLILIAANETTVNLIANTLKTVLTDPRFRGQLSGGSMTLPDALEQVLWDAPPLNAIPGRWALSDTNLGEQVIKQGDFLVLALAAANRDPAIRPDLSASLAGNKSHVSMSSGPHECPGQDIGRSIADTGIEVLLGRLPDMALAVAEEDLHHNATWLTRHLDSLPVTFTPSRPNRTVETAAKGTSPALPEQVPAPQPPATPQAMPPQQAPMLAAPAATAVPAASGRRPSLWARLLRWAKGRG